MQNLKSAKIMASGLIVTLSITGTVAATLEEVVVTTQKRAQQVQHVPITVNTVS